MNLPELSIRQPVLAVMMIGSLVVLGIVALPRLELGLLPKAELPIVSVTTRLPGASPDTVEREITQPLEEALNTIDGIQDLVSTSSESLSQIIVSFDLEQDAHAKAQDVRDRVARARAELPRSTEAPLVERFDPYSQPILAVLFSSSGAIRPLTERVDKKIKPRLERLSGVGSISLIGGRKREIRIWIDPLRIAGYGLAVDDVLDALRREHVEIPGGRIETDLREYTVKTRGRLTRAEQFGSIVIAERGGRAIHLRDVATAEDGMQEERTLSFLNSRRGVSLLIRRQSGANIVRVARAVKAELAALRPSLPPGVDFIVARDMSRFIERSVRSVAEDLAWGALLATLIVLGFLRNVRSTLIAGIAIPTSVVASFALFYFFDLTLNNLTLAGLSLSVGILIDDAIVVVENILRHMERGGERRSAALQATREIGLAVVATTLAICAVFVPIAFMAGTVGRYFREFGLVVTCAVTTSTIVALTLTPMLSSRYLRLDNRESRIYETLERGYRGLERFYRRVLRWALAHRPHVLGIAGAALVGGLGIATTLPVDFVEMADRSEFNVVLKLPVGSPIHRTLAATSQIEERLLEHREIRAVFSTIGAGARRQVHSAELYVQLTDAEQRSVSQADLMEDVRGVIENSGIGFEEFSVEAIPWMSVRGGSLHQLRYAIRGPEIATLDRYAQALLARMEAADGYVDLATSYETGRPEISLEIARERAADLGVPAEQIGRTLSTLLGGLEVTSFEEKGERYDVRVQLRPEYRNDPLKLGLLSIRSREGALINLSNLVTPRMQAGPVEIHRENRARVIHVLGNLSGKALGTAVEEIRGFIDELEIEDGYEIAEVGLAEHMEETLQNVVFAFVLAMIAMYMILASQFNSFIHPLTIMLCAPLSFIGAFAALAIFGRTFSMMSQIGLLILMGLVMKNGILLVDYTRKLRDRGKALREAILEAGPTRLRPVLMTTVSTVCGMIPLAFSGGTGIEFRSSMGLIVIGGLITSMALTLLVVPITYSCFEDLQTSLLRLAGQLRSRSLAQLRGLR
ncbi:MAG: efflux RND transporter permease subunit [Myxococcota bacterium]